MLGSAMDFSAIGKEFLEGLSGAVKRQFGEVIGLRHVSQYYGLKLIGKDSFEQFRAVDI